MTVIKLDVQILLIPGLFNDAFSTAFFCEYITSKLRYSNARHYSNQRIFSWYLHSTNFKIKMYKMIILLFCMVVELCLSHKGKKKDWRYLEKILRRLFGHESDMGENKKKTVW
jgi:hypothetical protein